MDNKTKTFGLDIGNGLTTEVYSDIKSLENSINEILTNDYKYEGFANHSLLAKNAERLTKTYPYQEHYRSIGTKYIVDTSFIENFDINKFKEKINSILNDDLGVNKINIIKESKYSYIEILVSFKEWKSLNNGAHFDYLKTKFENEYSEHFFGEKFKNQYINSFNEVLSNKQITNYNVKIQLEAYLNNNKNNDIDDYLNDLEKIKIMNLYDVDFFAGGNILLSSKTNEQQIYICDEFVSKHENRNDMNEFLINLTGFTLPEDIRNERIEKGALNKEQSLEFINYLLNSNLKQDIKDRLLEFKENLIKSIENNDSKNFSFHDL